MSTVRISTKTEFDFNFILQGLKILFIRLVIGP